MKEVIQNQTATQQLNGLIVQSREVKSIHREQLERGVIVDTEGSEELIFNQPPPVAAAAPPAAAAAATTDQVQ